MIDMVKAETLVSTDDNGWAAEFKDRYLQPTNSTEQRCFASILRMADGRPSAIPRKITGQAQRRVWHRSKAYIQSPISCMAQFSDTVSVIWKCRPGCVHPRLPP